MPTVRVDPLSAADRAPISGDSDAEAAAGEAATEATLQYAVAGDGPTVAFLPDVGCGGWQWGWQHAAVAGPFEALVLAPRGVGSSTGAPAGTVTALAADVETLLADHGARRVHLVGAGLGAAVALECVRASGRVRSLSLFGCPLTGDRVDAAALEAMLPPEGLDPLVSPAFRERQPEAAAGIVEWRREGDGPPAVGTAHAAAFRAFACETPYEITVPTLVAHGLADPIVPLDAGAALAEALPRARFEPLPGRHFAFIESSRAANDALVSFLETVTDDPIPD